ncbi:MAG: serine hydrolase, partial [Thermoanaerobaculia bacterium]
RVHRRRPVLRRLFGCLLLASWLPLAGGCASAPAAATPARAGAEETVAAASRRCGCRMGVAARHLESGRSFEHNASEVFESASVIKIAILTEAMAGVRDGRIDLSARWTMAPEALADGSGVLLLLDPGLAPTWNDLLTLMIGPSDNTATNAWIERLGTDQINARMAAVGLPRIQLLGRIPSLSSRGAQPSPWSSLRLGEVTPKEVADWMERVARGEMLDRESSGRIFAYLDKDPSRLRIARRFPSAALWAGKTGSMRGVRNDAGVLRTNKGRFVLVILTDGSTAESTSPADHPSVLAIADVAASIVRDWSGGLPDLPESPR